MSPTTPPAPGTPTVRLPLTQAKRLAVEHVILAIVLPAVAGVINGTGFHLLGTYTSHVSGHTTRLGLAMATGQLHEARSAAYMVGMYFLGGMVATFLMALASHLRRARYILPLLTELACVAAFAVLVAGLPSFSRHIELAGLLCLAMGLQNAMVTKISGAVVRTTHVTGIVTDSAIELALLIIAAVEGPRGPGRLARLTALPDFVKLRLHLSILTSFGIGAVGGCLAYEWAQELALLMPCVALAGLALFDLMLGIRGVAAKPLPAPKARPAR